MAETFDISNLNHMITQNSWFVISKGIQHWNAKNIGERKLEFVAKTQFL